MNHFELGIEALKARVKSARTDISEITDLRKETGAGSFLVNKTLFVWVSDDKTPDDGATVIRPKSLSASSPGRFRLTGLAHPHAS